MNTAAPRRLFGTPVLVNEAGGFIGSSAVRVPTRMASTTPVEHLKRMYGTPCFVTASGAIVPPPLAHRGSLKRLWSTPCFVNEVGEIVGGSSYASSFSRTHTTGRSPTPVRLPGTPCFVDANGEIIGPAQPPVRCSGSGRVLGPAINGSGDKQRLMPSAIPIAAAVAVPVLQVQATSSFSTCQFPPTTAANDAEQQRKQSLVEEMEAQIAALRCRIHQLSV